MSKQPTQEFGQADQLDAALGLDQIVGPKLASIIVFAANIEYHLERAIWVLDKIDPKDIRPETDAKPITELITMLEKHAASVTDDTMAQLRILLRTAQYERASSPDRMPLKRLLQSAWRNLSTTKEL